MNVFCLLLVQALLPSAPGEGDFPRLSDPEPAQEVRREIYPWLGLEARAVWTVFDPELRIKDAWGGGADVTVTLDYGTRAFLGFRAGYLAWNTRTDQNVPGKDSVQVRQYRVGIFGEFPLRFLEVGVGANVGSYRFRQERDNDTPMYFEIEAHLGVRPHPQVWAGVVGMQSMTITDFNRSSFHGIVNFSIGPALEFRF